MDTLTPAQRSRNMSRIRGRDTIPEKRVRSVLHRMGFRFRLCVAALPGSPDIVLPKYKAVIFVHGCFWHGHDGCRRATLPGTRRAFWENKISGTKDRDRRNAAALSDLGYRCIVIWQCELKDEEALKRRLATFLTGTEPICPPAHAPKTRENTKPS